MLDQAVDKRTTGAALRQALLAPRRVALIGASDDPTKTAARPLQYLRRMGFPGAIYPINPRRDQVGGEQAWRSLEQVPERPDHAYILTPTESAIEAVEECGRLGIPVATVLADGFASGDAAENRSCCLRDICERTGIRVVGPSCLGVVNLRERLVLTANAAFAEPDLPVGRIFAASQSGSVIGALVSRGKARGVGFAGLISVGNELDLSAGEVCAATLDDPDIDGYMLFLETFRHADDLRRFAIAAAERGKPVVAYKLGRSSEARELAATHTGALAGEDDVADAFLADCGIARVGTFEALIEALPLLRRMPIVPTSAPKPTVGVVTTTGGAAAMVVDQLSVRDVPVVGPTSETLEKLTVAATEVDPGRIVDLTLAGARYPIMKGALDTMLAASEFGLVIAVVGSSARFQPELAVQPVIDSANGGKPLAAFLAPEAPEALLKLAQGGVPSFRTPEACADAVAAALGRRPPKPIARGGAAADAPSRMLDEAQAYELLDRVGLPRAPTVVLDARLPAPPLLPFNYPVALKVLNADIAHKTDAGGVALGIADGEGLVRAIRTMRAAIAQHRPDAAFERVLVQPMMAGAGEALIGYRIDAEVGPIILLAAGGIMTEIYQDRALRLAPVGLDDARAMIAEVKAFRALAGFRGKPPGDLEALANAIVKLSLLAVLDEPVLEAEINPLMVRPAGQGVIAVDALVRIAG
jgi:acyl-CoA synthetase (NDP forming)